MLALQMQFMNDQFCTCTIIPTTFIMLTLSTILKAAPEASEAISYGIPTFKLNGRPLVYFAAWKNHIGFYPMPSAAKAFKRELSVYKQGKGSVQFPLDKPIPYGLVKKIVKFRVSENLS
jgi:uncharacterized protein YdhG (YjbR/CyaY superfamily)